MILPIKLYGDPMLRISCKEVDVFDNNIINFIHDMYDTMYQNNGIGLAAPQVGRNLRIFVVDSSIFELSCKRVFINPEIIKIYGKTWIIKEGCLSFPSFIAKIKRYEYIHIRYYNEYLKKCEETFQGFSSRVIQHEYDHLEGKMLIDYLK